MLRLREGLYKGSAVLGMALSINAFEAVHSALDPELSQAVKAHGPVRDRINNSQTNDEYYQRGRELFGVIYGHRSRPFFFFLVVINLSSQPPFAE